MKRAQPKQPREDESEVEACLGHCRAARRQGGEGAGGLVLGLGWWTRPQRLSALGWGWLRTGLAVGPPAEVEAPLGSARHRTLPPGAALRQTRGPGWGVSGASVLRAGQPALCPLEMKGFRSEGLGSGSSSGSSCLGVLEEAPRFCFPLREVGMLGMPHSPGGGCVQGSHAD